MHGHLYRITPSLRIGLLLSLLVFLLLRAGTTDAASLLTCGKGQWHFVKSPGRAVGISALSAKDIWAVGDGQTSAFSEHWNGTRWKNIPTVQLQGAYYLTAVAALSASDAWAVGVHIPQNAFLPLTEYWNGIHWSVVPNPSQGGVLTAVAAISTQDVWAVGYGSGYVTLTEHWDGHHWRIVPSPNPGVTQVLYGVVALSSTDVWGVGFYAAAHTVDQALTEHWNGTQWSVVPSPSPGTFTNGLSAVAEVSKTNLWTVGWQQNNGGYVQPLTEHWDGTQWRMVPSPNPDSPNSVLSSIVVVSPSNVWAVGEQGTTDFLAEQWSGTKWTLKKVPPIPGNYGEGLSGVTVVPGISQVWAVGYYVTYDGSTHPVAEYNC